MIPNIPGAPLIIGGEEYHVWRPAFKGEGVTFRANPDQTTIMFANLGKRIPGMMDDGLRVEFMIYSVQGLGPEGSEVLAHVDIRSDLL